MGAVQSMCGENILNKLMTQYGGDILAFITAQKSKYLIDDKFTELQRKFHEAFHDFENTVKKFIESKVSQITSVFEGIKNKANSLLPGGIATLERVKGQSINDFSGFNSIVSKIQSVKSDSLGNLSLKKQQMMQKLGQEKTQMTETIQKSKPSIPFYDQISDPLRRQLFKEAEEKFSKELGSQENDLSAKIMGLFNGSALQRMFSEMSPEGVLQKILAEGLGVLERNIFSNITGGTSGAIGNVIGNIGGLTNMNGGFGNIFSNIIN